MVMMMMMIFIIIYNKQKATINDTGKKGEIYKKKKRLL